MKTENTVNNYKQTSRYLNPTKQDYSGVALLEKETEKPVCPACATSGQLCLQHLKSDKKIVSIADLLDGITTESANASPTDQKKIYHQMQAVYATTFLDSLPANFVMTRQMLEKIAAYHAKQGGLEQPKLYAGDKKDYAYQNAANKGYSPNTQPKYLKTTDYNKN